MVCEKYNIIFIMLQMCVPLYPKSISSGYIAVYDL